jgi:hypothetical protein
MDDYEFAERLLNERRLPSSAPRSVGGAATCVCATPPDLLEALERIGRFVGRHS